MTQKLDPVHEQKMAHDTPLFASLPGDLAVSFEFFPPKSQKMEDIALHVDPTVQIELNEKI